MTVVSMVKKQTDKRGWLWRRDAPGEPWVKVFASLKSTHLSVFRDDKAAQPLEELSIAGASVQDAGVEAGRPPGRSGRVLVLQGSLKTEELRSLLPQCGLSLRAAAKTLHLAASDPSEHTHWLKLLRQASSVPDLARSVVVDEERLLNGFASKGDRHARRVAKPSEPSLRVSSYLLSPDAAAEWNLIPALGRARAALKEGVVNLGAAREEAQKCQFALNSVRRQLRDIDLSITHQQREPENDADAVAACETRDWLEQSLAMMADVDASLDSLQAREPPLSYDWETFAHGTMLRLLAMEEALRLGRHTALQRRVTQLEPPSPQKCSAKGPIAAPVAWRPVLPYSHYKLRPAL